MKTLLTSLLLGTFFAMSTASADSSLKSQDVVISVDTKVLKTSDALLQALDVLMQGVYSANHDDQGATCTSRGTISGVDSDPVRTSPLKVPYMYVNVKWNCTETRDLLVTTLDNIKGIRVLPRNVVIGIHPAVIRAN